ncbi:MAG: hypothetical protein AAGG68_01020 [Bacteroidota bacterium]
MKDHLPELSFAENVPYKGIILPGSQPDPSEFIGHLRLEDFGDLNFYYFKNYEFNSDNQLFFKPFNSSLYWKEHIFNLCFVRLRGDFQLIAYDYDKKKNEVLNAEAYPPIEQLQQVRKNYFGLFLLNIHLEGDNSLAARNFINPNFHLETKYEQQPEAIEKSGGPHGCETFVAFGNDKIPFFREYNEKKLRPSYFMMARGTDNAISFCEMYTDKKEEAIEGEEKNMVTNDMKRIPARLIESVKEAHKTAPSEEYKLGFANWGIKQYDVTRFQDRYGLHILDKADSGWAFKHYKTIEYRD